MNLIIFVVVGLCLSKICFSHEIRTNKRAIANPLWNETVLDKLRNDLLTNYDRYAKPSHHRESSNISIGFGISYLETDELKSSFSVVVQMRLMWTDPKLAWNPRDYNDLDYLTIADHEIWQPNLYLINSASSGGEAIARYGNAIHNVFSNGSVVWVTSLRFTAWCQFDLFYWPFDSQRCQLRFGSWSNSVKDIRLTIDKISYEFMVQLSQWNVSYTTQAILVNHDLYPQSTHHVVLNLELTRKPSGMSNVVIAIVVSTALLVIIQHFVVLPTEQSLILSSFSCVSVCLCLLYFSAQVISMGSGVPWVVVFFSTCLVLHVLTIIKQIALAKPHLVPWTVKAHLYGKLGQTLLLDDCVLQSEEDSNWTLLTVAIDRVSFVCYSFILVVLFLVYLV